MKRESSTASRALRAVSLVITLVTIVTVSTILYSAYVDISGVLSTSGLSSAPSSGRSFVVSGNTATLKLNFSVKNSGFYPLTISFGCRPDPSVPATCSTTAISIPAGTTKTLPVVFTISDVPKLLALTSGGRSVHLNATAQVSLVPFATISANFDLGKMLSGAAP